MGENMADNTLRNFLRTIEASARAGDDFDSAFEAAEKNERGLPAGVSMGALLGLAHEAWARGSGCPVQRLSYR